MNVFWVLLAIADLNETPVYKGVFTSPQEAFRQAEAYRAAHSEVIDSYELHLRDRNIYPWKLIPTANSDRWVIYGYQNPPDEFDDLNYEWEVGEILKVVTDQLVS